MKLSINTCCHSGLASLHASSLHQTYNGVYPFDLAHRLLYHKCQRVCSKYFSPTKFRQWTTCTNKLSNKFIKHQPSANNSSKSVVGHHEQQLYWCDSAANTHKYSFYVRTILQRNVLPNHVVNSKSATSFRRGTCRHH